MFAVILGAFGDPFVGFAVFKKKNLYLGPGITLAPFNGIGFTGSPTLAAVGGGDFKRTTPTATGLCDLEILVAFIEYLFVLYRGDLDLVGTAGNDGSRYLPDQFAVILGFL